MNFSIKSLALSRVTSHSPLITQFGSQLKYLSFQKSSFDHFTSNFIRMSMPSGKAMFSKVKFGNFLKTPVKFIETDIKKSIFTQHKEISTAEGPVITMTSCLFQNCTTQRAGGGLLCIGPNYNLTLQKSSFFNCDSLTSKGGGLQFDGDSLILYHTCFSFCEADTYGQALHAESSTQNNIIIEGCNINFCTERPSETGEESSPVELYRGKHKLTETNITDCIVTMLYSGFHTDDSTSSYIMYNTFKNNTGNIVVGAEDIKLDDEIAFCSFIENKKQDDGYGVIYTNVKMIVANCVFINNYEYLAQSDVTLDFTFRNCEFNTNYGQVNKTGPLTVYFTNCKSDPNAKPIQISKFDTRYCWELDPPTLPAGNSTYWFFLVFIVFAGMVSFTTFLSFKRLRNPSSAVNADPLVKDKENTYN